MRARSHRHCGARGERGQVLVLFAVMFTVIMAMGAFALDQGLAYGKHGLSQSNADTASRAGAFGCVVALSEGDSVSNACRSDAEDAATENASANGVAAADVTPDGDNECLGEGNNDFPSMTVEVDKTSPSLFSKFFGLGNFTAKSQAVTCLGALQQVRDGGLEMLPAWMSLASTSGGSHDPNKQYCGDPSGSGYHLSGEVCTIFATGSTGNDLDSAGLLTQGSGNTTCGATNDSGVLTAIRTGLTPFTCSVGQRLRNEGVSDNSVLSAFHDRLQRANACPSGSLSRSAFSDIAQAVGDTGNGGPDFVFDDSSNGSADDDETVYQQTAYQQQNCQLPRLVLIPLVDQTFSRNKEIAGFTAAYILGCYPGSYNYPVDRSATTTMNDCNNNDRGYRDGGPCQHYDDYQDHGHRHHDCVDDTDTEVRVGVVRMYMAGDSVQTIGRFANDDWISDISGMAIQTAK